MNTDIHSIERVNFQFDEGGKIPDKSDRVKESSFECIHLAEKRNIEGLF